MLSLFAIISGGGLVLCSLPNDVLTKQQVELVNELVEKVIIKGNFMEEYITIANQMIHWQRHGNDLIFIACHPKILPLTGIPLFLELMRKFVDSKYGARLSEKQPLSKINISQNTLQEVFKKSQNLKNSASPSSSMSFRKEKTSQAKSANNNGGKILRDWGDRVDKKKIAELDFSEKCAGRGSPEKQENSVEALPSLEAKELAEIDFDELLCEGEGDEEEAANSSSGLWHSFAKLAGTASLTETDLRPAIQLMRDHLINKNVAANVADFLCERVKDDLVGVVTGTWQNCNSLVKSSMQRALAKILTPSTHTNLLSEIRSKCQNTSVARKQASPFVMMFVGVNGVGKSTSLSKICCWLLQNNFKVLLVAGDTFRAGAVEQLKRHVANLKVNWKDNVQLFERGYGKDAASLAKDAIKHASHNAFDVVMIDTAGRMQDNIGLMGALGKLASQSSPDQIVFVGEALVGNESVDQLCKFNDALKIVDHSISAIMLTKYDTVDDKVGACVTMAFVSGAPILWVGVGQTYGDLAKINVKQVVAYLLN